MGMKVAESRATLASDKLNSLEVIRNSAKPGKHDSGDYLLHCTHCMETLLFLISLSRKNKTSLAQAKLLSTLSVLKPSRPEPRSTILVLTSPGPCHSQCMCWLKKRSNRSNVCFGRYDLHDRLMKGQILEAELIAPAPL